MAKRLFTLHVFSFRIPVHPAFLALIGLSLLTGARLQMRALLSALFLHELGHIFAALVMKMKLDAVEILPFGARLETRAVYSCAAYKGFVLSLGGPFVSLAVCLFAKELSGVYFSALLSYSWLVFVFNMLPLLPLDGGNALRYALRDKVGYVRVTRILCRLAQLAALLGLVYSACLLVFFRPQFFPAAMSLYLMYAASSEMRADVLAYVDSLIARRQRLSSTAPIPVQELAADESMELVGILRHLKPECYHRVLVVDGGGMKIIGILEDAALLGALASAPTQSLSAVLAERTA
ncbi:MAG: hypothetical protein PHI27_11200 [Eubacteriales bacterium]|nr:hypothetical protein [Eubacteriales bacterium]MDD3882797.1 hypothetical protein [Eubacteriales bacterium]MDD4513305.1 hypothetical protein [Eubacteriales bacterium]